METQGQGKQFYGGWSEKPSIKKKMTSELTVVMEGAPAEEQNSELWMLEDCNHNPSDQEAS